MLFAHLKLIPKLDPLRLRGPDGTGDEFRRASAHARPTANGDAIARLRPEPAAADA